MSKIPSDEMHDALFILKENGRDANHYFFKLTEDKMRNCLSTVSGHVTIVNILANRRKSYDWGHDRDSWLLAFENDVRGGAFDL